MPGIRQSDLLARHAVSTYPRNVSAYRVTVVARNPKDEDRATPPIEVLVDTGSELTWLPQDELRQIGVVPTHQRSFATATRQVVPRDVGYAILAAEGFETAAVVVLPET